MGSGDRSARNCRPPFVCVNTSPTNGSSHSAALHPYYLAFSRCSCRLQVRLRLPSELAFMPWCLVYCSSGSDSGCEAGPGRPIAGQTSPAGSLVSGEDLEKKGRLTMFEMTSRQLFRGRCLAMLSTAVFGFGLSAVRANADQWDKKTTVTFNAPVEVPGKVLPAGTYVFKLVRLSVGSAHCTNLRCRSEEALCNHFGPSRLPSEANRQAGASVCGTPSGAPKRSKRFSIPATTSGSSSCIPISAQSSWPRNQPKCTFHVGRHVEEYGGGGQDG